jgi:hypothetical protein
MMILTKAGFYRRIVPAFLARGGFTFYRTNVLALLLYATSHTNTPYKTTGALYRFVGGESLRKVYAHQAKPL